MIIQENSKLQNFLAFIVIGCLPFYYFLRELVVISSIVYACLLGLLFILALHQNIGVNVNLKSTAKKFFLLEFMMVLNILFVLVYLGHIERSLVLLFITLFISKSLFISKTKHDFEVASNIVTWSALFAAMGVTFGLAESMIGNSNFFTQIMSFDYPYSDGLRETTLINGFFASANGSAYALGAGIAFTKFQNVINGSFRKNLYLFFIFALFVTKAKFAFLLAAAFLGFSLLKKLPTFWLMAYLSILGASYIFLSHIMIAYPGTYDYPSLHFREKLFTIGTVDFVLGNYGAFKLFTFEAILENNFMPIGLDAFVKFYSGRPHFMIGALVISGGFISAVLALFYIYLLLQEFWMQILIGLSENRLYLAILFCFAIETVNWNFTNSFYFWAIIMGLGSINGKKKVEANQKDLNT